MDKGRGLKRRPPLSSKMPLLVSVVRIMRNELSDSR